MKIEFADFKWSFPKFRKYYVPVNIIFKFWNYDLTEDFMFIQITWAILEKRNVHNTDSFYSHLSKYDIFPPRTLKTYQNAPKIISQKCGDLDLIDIWRTGIRMIIDIHSTDENQKYTAALPCHTWEAVFLSKKYSVHCSFELQIFDHPNAIIASVHLVIIESLHT